MGLIQMVLVAFPVLYLYWTEWFSATGERSCPNGERFLVSVPFVVIHSQSNIYREIILKFKTAHLNDSNSEVEITTGALCYDESIIRIPVFLSWGEKPPENSTEFDMNSPQNVSICFTKNYSIVSVEPLMTEKTVEGATYIQIASIPRPSVEIISNESETVTIRLNTTTPLMETDQVYPNENNMSALLSALSSLNYTGCVYEEYFINGATSSWLDSFQQGVMRTLDMVEYILLDQLVLPILKFAAVKLTQCLKDISFMGAIIAGSTSYLLGPSIIQWLGFTQAGITPKSFAARFMSFAYSYGVGHSLLSYLQAAGKSGKLGFSPIATMVLFGWLIGASVDFIIWRKTN